MCVGRTGASVVGLPVLARGLTTTSAFARFPVVGSACGPERTVFTLFRMST